MARPLAAKHVSCLAGILNNTIVVGSRPASHRRTIRQRDIRHKKSCYRTWTRAHTKNSRMCSTSTCVPNPATSWSSFHCPLSARSQPKASIFCIFATVCLRSFLVLIGQRAHASCPKKSENKGPQPQCAYNIFYIRIPYKTVHGKV